MRRFAIHTPAPVLSLAAAAAAFLTLTLAVVLPAQLAPYDGHPFMIAARDATAVSIVPGRIDVTATRPHATAEVASSAQRAS